MVTWCRAEPGDLYAATRTARSDGRLAPGSASDPRAAPSAGQAIRAGDRRPALPVGERRQDPHAPCLGQARRIPPPRGCRAGSRSAAWPVLGDGVTRVSAAGLPHRLARAERSPGRPPRTAPRGRFRGRRASRRAAGLSARQASPANWNRSGPARRRPKTRTVCWQRHAGKCRRAERRVVSVTPQCQSLVPAEGLSRARPPG